METKGLVNDYLHHCQEKGDSTSTLVLKDSILRRFAAFCPELPAEALPVYQFLQTSGRSPASRKSARNTIRAFYSFACQKHDLPDPMPQVAVPTRAVKRPQGRIPQHIVDRRAAQTTISRPLSTPPEERLSTAEAITAFLSSKKGRWKDQTFTWYDATFIPFTTQFKILPTDPDTIWEFISAPDTKHKRWTRFRSLRTLYIFLHKRKDIANPFDKLDSFSPDEAPVIPLDDDEIGRILSLDLSAQEQGIVHTLLTTGMRPGEARNLRPDSIMEQTIVLNGKTGVDSMPIKPEVRDLLLKISGQIYVFEDDEGRPLTKDGFYRILENIMLRANVRDGKGGARVFRHTFITRVYDESGDPFLVQRLARHASLTMTKHYEHAALKSTIKKYQGLDFLTKTLPVDPEISEKDLEEPEPFPVQGTVQLGWEIPPAPEEPTGPYTIKEYAYKLKDTEGKGYPLKCWRIIGSNGASWPISGNPYNFYSFEEAQEKLRELWQKVGSSEK